MPPESNSNNTESPETDSKADLQQATTLDARSTSRDTTENYEKVTNDIVGIHSRMQRRTEEAIFASDQPLATSELKDTDEVGGILERRYANIALRIVRNAPTKEDFANELLQRTLNKELFEPVAAMKFHNKMLKMVYNKTFNPK